MTDYLTAHSDYSNAIGRHCAIRALSIDSAFNAYGIDTPDVLEPLIEDFLDDLDPADLAALGYRGDFATVAGEDFLIVEPIDGSHLVDRERLAAALRIIN